VGSTLLRGRITFEAIQEEGYIGWEIGKKKEKGKEANDVPVPEDCFKGKHNKEKK